MLLSPSKSSYIENVIDQNYENLSDRAINSKYFGLQFKILNYCFNTGIDELDKIGSNFAISPHSDFGVMFALNKISYFESLIGFSKDINYIWINHISHFVYLNEIAISKMLDHICKNINLDLTFKLFFSNDNLMRISLILDHDHH